MATKFEYDEHGNIITVDPKTGKKTGEIGTMGNVMAEVEEKRKIREQAMKLLEERKKHPTS